MNVAELWFYAGFMKFKHNIVGPDFIEDFFNVNEYCPGRYALLMSSKDKLGDFKKFVKSFKEMPNLKNTRSKYKGIDLVVIMLWVLFFQNHAQMTKPCRHPKTVFFLSNLRNQRYSRKSSFSTLINTHENENYCCSYNFLKDTIIGSNQTHRIRKIRSPTPTLNTTRGRKRVTIL